MFERFFVKLKAKKKAKELGHQMDSWTNEKGKSFCACFHCGRELWANNEEYGGCPVTIGCSWKRKRPFHFGAIKKSKFRDWCKRILKRGS